MPRNFALMLDNPWVFQVFFFLKKTVFMHSLYICLSHTKFQISKMTYLQNTFLKLELGEELSQFNL